ncbi:MAG: putative transposase [Candidatus Promineifilaceae bacterium]|jgi:putative transposase
MACPFFLVLLRCRVRYFSDGAVMGSRAYVEDVFQRHRQQFGEKRKTGARPMRGGDWGDLMTARRLRLTPIRA